MRSRVSEGSTLTGVFKPSDIVTITIYDLADNSEVVSAAACSEVGSSGIFKYKPALSPTAFAEYSYVMTNGILKQYGTFELGGYPEELITKADDLHLDVNGVHDDLAAAQGSIEGKVDGVQGDVTAVKAVTDTITWPDIDDLIDLVGGNRIIQNNQMIYFKADGVTEVARFNLFDQAGQPTMINVVRRVRVL